MRHSARLSALCVSTCLFVSPAAALTPEEAWQIVQDVLAAADMPLGHGAVTRQGDRLVVSDLTATQTMPDDGGTLTATVAELVLRDLGEGAVEVTISPEVTVRGRTRPGDSLDDLTEDALEGLDEILPDEEEEGLGDSNAERPEMAEFSGTLRQTNAKAILSGTPEDLTFDISADALDSRIETTVAAAGTAAVTVRPVSFKGHIATATGTKGSATYAAGNITSETTEARTPGRTRLAVSDLAGDFNFDTPTVPASKKFLGGTGASTTRIGKVVVEAGLTDDAGAAPDFVMTLERLESAIGGKSGPEGDEGKTADVELDATFRMGRMTADGSLDEPGDENPAALTLDLKELSLSLDGAFPGGFDEGDFGAAVAGGTRMAFGLDLAEGSYDIHSTAPDETFRIANTFTAASAAISLGPDGAALRISQGPTTGSVSTANLPGPVDVSLGGLTFNIVAPGLPEKGPGPVEATIALSDFAASEAVWALFDPGKVLPRDPLSLLVDVRGTATAMENIFVEDRPTDDIPLLFDKLDRIEVALNGLGADVKGSGTLTFAGDTPPQTPIGKLAFTLTGVQGVIGKLSTLGVLDPEALLGARGAIGMFTRATGSDVLQSHIEFRPEGTILVNGLPFPIE